MVCKVGVEARGLLEATQRNMRLTGRTTGIRVHVARSGFFLLKNGNRRYASCSQVIGVLMQAVNEPNNGLSAVARTHLLSLSVIGRQLQARQLQEGVAARRLLMIIGNELELAVSSAVTASLTPGRGKAALARARASVAGDAASLAGLERLRARASAVLQRRRSSGVFAVLQKRRSSGRLSLRRSRSTGLRQVSSSADAEQQKQQQHQHSEQHAEHAAAVSAAFAREEAVQRAQRLLLRAARREEAAMMVQAVWRLHFYGPSQRLSERIPFADTR